MYVCTCLRACVRIYVYTCVFTYIPVKTDFVDSPKVDKLSFSLPRYESLAMVLLYIFYVVLMYFNKRVGHYVMNNIHIFLDNRKLIKNNEFTLANDTKKPLLAEQILRPGDVISTDMKKTKDNYGIYGTLENSHPDNGNNI